MSDANDPEGLRDALIAAYRRPESRSVGLMELRELPLLSIVLLGLRAVYRVRPLFRPLADDPHRELSQEAIGFALEVVERFVRGEPMTGIDLEGIEQLVHSVSRRAIPGSEVAHAASSLVKAVREATDADSEGTVYAAGEALFVSGLAVPLTSQEGAEELEKAVQGQLLDLGPAAIRDAIATDYETVRSLQPGQHPELGQRIDPSEGGPLGLLWPDGTPSWAEGG